MNTKGILKYVVLLVIAAVIYAVINSQKPKELDWRTTYDNRHKIPYGTRALFEMLPQMFDEKISTSRQSIYQALKNTYENDFSNHYTDGEEIVAPPEDPNMVEWGEPDSAGYYSDSAMAKVDSAAKAQAESDSIAAINDKKLYPPVEDYKWQIQTKPRQTYIFIQNEFSPDATDEEQLLNFVGRGNTVFIAAEYFNRSFAYRLGFDLRHPFVEGSLSNKVPNTLRLIEGPYWGKAYLLEDAERFPVFSTIDTSTTKILGTDKFDDANLVSIKYGAGYFLISTNPKAFTNYHILKSNNYEYATSVLSYLPKNRPVLWDQYFKEGSRGGKSGNPLRVLLENKSARIALYLVAILFVLYIVFFGKRTQRIIPLVLPFSNSTVEFTQTVGRLYYQKRDHKNLALKKYYFLLDFIRQHYFMGSNEINREFSDKLAAKTNYPPTKLWLIFSAVDSIKLRDSISEEELIVFNNNIEDFYNHIKTSTSKTEIQL